MLVPLLVGVASARLLLRSWWAMLIVPIAFSFGFYLSNFLMGGFDLQQWAASHFEGLDILVLFVVPVAIGVAIGTPTCHCSLANPLESAQVDHLCPFSWEQDAC
jgi:hypothetical protein